MKKYRSHFIDPMDSLYSIIQRRFLEEQTKVYGTDHIYGIDPFNEVDSPDWSEDFFSQCLKQDLRVDSSGRLSSPMVTNDLDVLL